MGLCHSAYDSWIRKCNFYLANWVTVRLVLIVFIHFDQQRVAIWSCFNIDEHRVGNIRANNGSREGRCSAQTCEIVAVEWDCCRWTIGVGTRKHCRGDSKIAGEKATGALALNDLDSTNGKIIYAQNSNFQISFLRNIVWVMSNLCRHKNPRPPFGKVEIMLPALAKLLRHDDNQILSKHQEFGGNAWNNSIVFSLQAMPRGPLAMQRMLLMKTIPSKQVVYQT